MPIVPTGRPRKRRIFLGAGASAGSHTSAETTGARSRVIIASELFSSFPSQVPPGTGYTRDRQSHSTREGNSI
jgi:hypothetical protein